MNQSMCNELKSKIFDLFVQELSSKVRNVQRKDDGSFVTRVDVAISKLIHKEYQNYKIYCEETFERWQNDTLNLKKAVILDPIDGTKELVSDFGECATSIAVFTEKSQWGMIYNPYTGFCITSDDNFHLDSKRTGLLCGLVSRTEWSNDLENKVLKDIFLQPRGSIAFKLGLLAAGACDFVVSYKPKNIWDIAAGTIILSQRGVKLYNSNHEIIDWRCVSLEGPLLWCREDYFDRLRSVLF